MLSIGPDLLETMEPAAADARQLTTVEKVKAALGVTDDNTDDLIGVFISQVADLAAEYCNLAVDSVGSKPTFGAETLKATWFRTNVQRGHRLLLPWRPSVTAASEVKEDGITLVSGTDYALASGILLRLAGDGFRPWCHGKMEVTFTAGWDLPGDVPPGIEIATIEQIKAAFTGRDRDPALVSQTIPEVLQQVWRVPGAGTGAGFLLPQVQSAFDPYRRIIV